jgi:hypothetical protein
MNVTGRPAQFGRGVIAEVGGKLIAKFADNLAELISGGNGPSADSAPAPAADSAPAAESSPAEVSAVAASDATRDTATGPGTSPAVAAPSAPTPAASATTAPAAPQGDDSLNLVRLVGPAILKRVVPVAAAVTVLALLGRRFRHLLRRGAQKG